MNSSQIELQLASAILFGITLYWYSLFGNFLFLDLAIKYQILVFDMAL